MQSMLGSFHSLVEQQTMVPGTELIEMLHIVPAHAGTSANAHVGLCLMVLTG